MGSVDDETSSVVMVTLTEEKGVDVAQEDAKPDTMVAEDAADDCNGENKDSCSDSESDSDDEEAKKIVVGMVAERKDLYQKMDKYNRATWTEQYPDDLEEAAENDETLKFAVLVRNKKSYDSRKKLEIDSIVIQSPLLKQVLHDVLKDYPGVTVTLARLTFMAPFKPFVHRWEQLTAALEGDYDETTKAHLKLLHNVLLEELKDVISATKDYIKNRVITYEHIWTIFQPGTIVYASRYGKPVAVRLNEGQFTNHQKYGHCYLLKCDRLEWDGSKFGYDNSQHIIFPFTGTLAITDLEAFPLVYLTEKEAITAALIARGRIFERMAGYHYKAYRGQAIEQKEWGPAKITIDCRIVVDAYAHGKANPNEQPSLKPLQGVTDTAKIHSEDPEDGYTYNYDNFSAQREEDIFLDGDNQPVPLTEDQLLLCTPIVKGYALKTKKWLEFYVDEVIDIVFNEHAFDSLVLPEGHKSLILAFAQSQIKYKDSFDDVISGKGKGIIMLLSGGPGIGKTLTAESVAEDMRVPLYMMSAGDLGSASWEVETKLTQVLEMVAKWNAVLLLDECDVFLEARSTSDLDRNRIVSIFLRTLEYYEGILFLTTNRVKNMDEAFHSRIHISLEYPSLDETARKAVWLGFLHRSTHSGGDGSGHQHELTEADVRKLAKLEINGRVIKNVLKTSHLLACHKGETLSYRHLKTVLQIEGYPIEE